MIQNKQITENAWVNNLCVSCNRLIIGSIQKTGELCINLFIFASGPRKTAQLRLAAKQVKQLIQWNRTKK